MDPSTEIRKLKPSNLRELVQILEYNESWKCVMAKIPKTLKKDSYECDVSLENLPKYNSEHFKLIENCSRKTNRKCAEILFDEWGTSGRIRPTLGHLLHLLVKTELFRAADYIAVTLLQTKPPVRPRDGPAALVNVKLPEYPQLPDPYNQEVERILDEIDYPSSVIANINNTSFDINIDHSNNNVSSGPRVIPKIVVSESPNGSQEAYKVPVVKEKTRKKHIRFSDSYEEINLENNVRTIVGSNHDVSDMMKFSQPPSDIRNDPNLSTSSNSTSLPLLTDLLENGSNNEITPQNVESGSNSLPLQSNQSITKTTGNLESQHIPPLSALLQDSSLEINDETQTDEIIPNLSALNADVSTKITSQHSEHAPNLSALLMSRSDDIQSHSAENIPNLSALNLSNTNLEVSNQYVLKSSSDNSLHWSDSSSISPIPQISTLISNDTGNSKQFLPIDKVTSDTQSNGSSFTSKNSSSEMSRNLNFSQNSNLSQSNSSSRPNCVSPLPNLSLNTVLPHLSYYELENGTNNFDTTPHKNCKEVENNLVETDGRFLGSGAFGSVYLAMGLLDRPIAVKKLVLNNVDVVNVDDTVTKQFKNEVEVLSKYKHENLLLLLGYSCDGPTYCLLYEYVPGGSLKERLQNTHDRLIWTDRLYIAMGTARAVSYLHTAYSTPLIHRDIKTANILLDCSKKPKLCDFGLIKLTPNQNTNTSTTVFGTSAYMAPEAFRGDVSVKSDTFSFGVVLLELLTSLPPMDENREGSDLVTHVDDVCESNSIEPLLDKKAGSWIIKDTNFAEQLYQISNNCLNEKKKRPTMVDVTSQLAKLLSDAS